MILVDVCHDFMACWMLVCVFVMQFGKEGLEPVTEKLFSVAGFKKSIKRAFSSAEQDSQKAAGEGEEVMCV